MRINGEPSSESLQCLHLHGAATILGTAILALLSACGSKTIATLPPPPGASTTTLQVNIGDAPADWMLAFSMDINSMSLVGSNGPVSVVSSAVPMEMMHLMGTMQPLSMVTIPQGTYTGATVTIGSPSVSYMDANTKAFTHKNLPAPATSTVTFASPLVLGATPISIGFDLDLANSIMMDAGGNWTMNPTFHVTMGAQGSGDPLEPSNGGIERMMGAVSNLSGNFFTMTSLQIAQPLTFMTNASTHFDNVANMGMMSNGLMMSVDASMQADGSLMATRVESLMNSGGVMGEGLVTAVIGKPATQLTIIMQNGIGAGMMSSSFSQDATVTISAGATCQIDGDGMDMSNLPFTPAFDLSHIYPGQSVMPIGSTGMTGGGGGGMMGGGTQAGTITASKLELEQQGMSGTTGSTLNSGSQSTSTITLPSDSSFTTLTGATTVTLYQQSTTRFAGTSSSIANGATIHVRGLLFFDSGEWKMVASRIGSL